MQARAMLAGVSGMEGGITRVAGRPLGFLGKDLFSKLLLAVFFNFQYPNPIELYNINWA